MIIYFDENKNAHENKIPNFICTTDGEMWAKHCQNAPATSWDIINSEFVDLTQKPEYILAQEKERKEWFEANFFNVTSIGWIRKKFTMKDGSVKDFLFDGFPMLASMITNNQLPANSCVIYNLPDFTKELTEAYLSSLNYKNELLTPQQTLDFVTTCKTQIVLGFFG